MVTKGVRDAIFGGNGTSQSTEPGFELATICTMENLASYRLGPPRGSPCYAIVTIVECTDRGFIVESMQIVPTPEKAEAASKSMGRLCSWPGQGNSGSCRGVATLRQPRPNNAASKANHRRALSYLPSSSWIPAKRRLQHACHDSFANGFCSLVASFYLAIVV